MPENTIMVFTGRPPVQVLEEEGTQAWALSPPRARKCTYVVCVQNRETFERFSPTEPHNMAFLIGKITEIALCEEQPDPDEGKPERYIIKFSEYARINVDATQLRHGNRNPVSYIDINDLNIDPRALEFTTLSKDHVPTSSIANDRPLTIQQAKEGLSLSFGVPPEAIEIIIRG